MFVWNAMPSMTPMISAIFLLRREPRRWLLTGSAGFIGSHLLQTLLELGQDVVSVDNLATGSMRNLEEVERSIDPAAWRRHRFIRGDIADPSVASAACEGRDVVVHQAALGSVPRSILDPLASNAANVTGTINLIFAAQARGIRRFVYASSSSVYGDHPALPKVEQAIGAPLSPYAVTKRADELYAHVAALCYGMQTVGLRYFNVFGPRQDPEGPYAAVIPRWVRAMLDSDPVVINGDGETTRDFCYIANVVQANLLAATVAKVPGDATVFNVAVGGRTSLNQLEATLRELLGERFPHVLASRPRYADFRAGDVRHSQADITHARTVLGFEPTHDLRAGLAEALPWYIARFGQPEPQR